MTTVMPHEELVRRAVQWVCAEREAHPAKALAALLDEAAQRFNLSPKDSEFLVRFFKEHSKVACRILICSHESKSGSWRGRSSRSLSASLPSAWDRCCR